MKYPEEFNRQSEINLWLSANDSLSFDYSDGTEAENYLEECIKNATDLSFDSVELAKYIRDWPSEYHLSPKRNNLLRCLNLKKTDTVLELGAGCGSITRYLGENTGQVIAVEGSQKRAKINALRCRNLDNVNVICSNFQDLELTEKFDIVTLIGVLEYSGKYIEAENPYQLALENAKKFLKEDGILVIAIENKFGMKYFAGCSEDHTGLLFDGIEGYPSKYPVRTFGKKELQDLLKISGFNCHQFLYPFPDYKVPDVILNLDEIEKYNYDQPFIYNWLGYSNSRDYGRAKNEYIHEFLLGKQLEKNGLLSQFGNSFLVVSSPNSDHLIKKYIDENTFASKFNATRYKHFMTGTYLKKLDENNLVIEKDFLYPDLAKAYEETKESQGFLKHEIHEKTPFLDGILLIDLFIEAFRDKTKNVEESLLEPLNLWYQFLLKFSQTEGENIYLSGKYIDCVPWNLMIEKNGNLVYIDQEWEYLEKIELNYVLFRGLFFLYQMFNPWIGEVLKNKDIILTLKNFVIFCTDLLDIDVTSAKIDQYLEMEFKLQTTVSYLSSPNFTEYLNLLEQKTQFLITELFIEKYESQLQQTQSQLQQTQSQLFIAKETISGMESSKFWKLRNLWCKVKSVFINQN